MALEEFDSMLHEYEIDLDQKGFQYFILILFPLKSVSNVFFYRKQTKRPSAFHEQKIKQQRNKQIELFV